MDQHLSRRTFAIISHPDAGKTTVTEKLLLFGGAISLAGTVKGRKGKHATSDWMEMERERGISVTTSVMQFPYQHTMVNLLDTPGHEDFSEDTYRTLTAVDSALMVIDAAKGVEDRTLKLMEVCRLRDTPVMTFINKLDREGRSPIALLDEVESVLKMPCSPQTWPIGMGRRFRGIYHLREDAVYLYEPGKNAVRQEAEKILGLHHPILTERFPEEMKELMEDIELLQGASHPFSEETYLKGKLTPVYFGSAINNFGISLLLNDFVTYAPPPQSRQTTTREVLPNEEQFSGFVFKIQANMDPKHRDRIAFLRVCSGKFSRGMKLWHVRSGKQMQANSALMFMAGEREQASDALPGDIIGIPNHGTLRIGDTLTEGESLKFIGVPNFAPLLFRSVRLKDPMKSKALLKGLAELSEEGAAQLFRPIARQQLILGAVGALQFEVVAHRLAHEYRVDCLYETVNIKEARWVISEDAKAITELKEKAMDYVALDAAGMLVYLAPTQVNLTMAMERYPNILFVKTCEH